MAAQYCIEYFYAKPACRDKLIRALQVLTQEVLSEPGCLLYNLVQDKQNPNLIILLVKFNDPKTMQQHEQQGYIQAFAEKELKEYCEKFSWHDGTEIN